MAIIRWIIVYIRRLPDALLDSLVSCQSQSVFVSTTLGEILSKPIPIRLSVVYTLFTSYSRFSLFSRYLLKYLLLLLTKILTTTIY